MKTIINKTVKTKEYIDFEDLPFETDNIVDFIYSKDNEYCELTGYDEDVNFILKMCKIDY